MTIRSGSWIIMMALAICLGAPVLAQDAMDQDKAARQREIETGAGLSARGQKILFRARTQQDAGDFFRAAEIVDQWLDGHPDREHALLLYNLAVSRFELDDAAGAFAALQKAVVHEPDFARAWLRLGEAAFAVENYATAAEAFARGHALTPSPRPEMLYYSGVAWIQADQPESAVAVLAQLLDTYREGADLDWYQALLAAAVETARPGRVEPYLDRLLADRPADPEAWELAYQYAAHVQDYRQAATYLTIAGYLRPLSPDEMDQLGDLYAVINVPLVAARYYQRALAADPPAPDESGATARRYERLASAWLAAHRRDEARTTLRDGLAVAQDSDLWSLLGDLEYMAEAYAEARTAFARSCELDPEYGRGWLMQGYCAIEEGDAAAASRYLRRATDFPAQAETAQRLLRQID